MRLLLPLVIAVALLLNACSVPKLRLPRVYKQTVQQGNVITQEMIDQLRPGMTRSQVAFIMGEPVFRNTFDDERWDYVYTIEIPGVLNQQQRVSLFFVDQELTYFTGDTAPSRYLNTPAGSAVDTAADTATETVIDQSAAAEDSVNQPTDE